MNLRFHWIACLFFFTLSAVAAAADSQPAASTQASDSVFCLDRRDPQAPAQMQQGLMIRELVRQAVLIAARDELGHSTRDQVLREPFPSGAAPMQIGTHIIGDRLRIELGSPGHGVQEYMVDVKTLAMTFLDEVALLERMEPMSRGEFVTALKQAGFAGQPNQAKPDAKAPDDAEALLGQMTFLAQFDAVRRAHESIRANGESPALLGVLVRGYANLGQLTQFHFSPAHKAFTARSLLYAQRMIAREPKSANARWHRAYALALTGFHKQALDDLASAKTLPGAAHAPAWVELIHACCHYETAHLIELASGGENGALAMYLTFLTIENCKSQGAVMNIAQAAAQSNPECLRLIDAMCDHTGPGMLNQLTPAGPAIFGQSLGARLEEIHGFPPAVIKQVKEHRRPGGNPEARAIVAAALVAEGTAGKDVGEPSWAALGRLIQETTFIHVYRQAKLIAMAWGVDASGYAQEAKPLIAEHPYRNLIEAYGAYHDGTDRWRQLAAQIKPVDTELQMEPMLQLIGSANPAAHVWAQAMAHTDGTAGECERLLVLYRNSPGIGKTSVDQLSIVTPHSPMAFAASVEADWEAASKEAPQWEADHAVHPAVAMALGQKYAELHKWPEAERSLKKYLEVAPDQEGYAALAEVYKAQGNEAKWLATLDEFLKQPDYGLQHAQVQVQIADYLMNQGEFEKAQPYAEAAAETRAYWAMRCAARAAVGLKQWEQAEAWVKEAGEHYSRPMDWYNWCRITGHGDEAAARKVVTANVKSIENSPDRELALSAAAFYLLTGETEKALPILKRMYETDGDPWAGLQFAMLTPEVTARAVALDTVMEKGPRHRTLGRPRPQLVELAGIFKEALASDPEAKPNAAEIERLVQETVEPREQSNIYYFTAKLMQLRGAKEEAAQYLKQCVLATATDPNDNAALACVELRSLGVDPMSLRAETRPATRASTTPSSASN